MVGIIATQLGTYFGYVFPAVGLPPLPWPLYNGILASTIADGYSAGTVLDPATGRSVIENFAVSSDAFFMGHTLHFVNGIVFALLWGVMFREDVAKWVKNNIARGLLYGVIMTIISAGLLVPYAYVPNSGYGLFLFDGPDAVEVVSRLAPRLRDRGTRALVFTDTVEQAEAAARRLQAAGCRLRTEPARRAFLGATARRTGAAPRAPGRPEHRGGRVPSRERPRTSVREPTRRAVAVDYISR